MKVIGTTSQGMTAQRTVPDPPQPKPRPKPKSKPAPKKEG